MPLSRRDQITIEKSPTYLYWSNVSERAFMLDPNMKFIIILRDPVVRAISQYTDFVTMNKRYKGNQKFPPINEQTNALHNHLLRQYFFVKKKDGDKTEISINYKIEYIYSGIYIKYIKQWLEYFPKENFIVLNGHKFIENPIIEMDRLQKFLGIDRLITEEHYKFDVKKGFHCMRIPLDSNNYTCLGSDKGRRNPNVYPETIERLKQFFKPYDKELFDFLNVEPFW
jgi:hypothetical protein